MRGSSVKIRRSLRTRVIAASALAFLGLAAVVCLVLPMAYEDQVRAVFAERSANVARGLSCVFGNPPAGSEPEALAACVLWLISDPVVMGAVVLDSDGRVLAHWPENGPVFDGTGSPTPRVEAKPSWNLAYHPLGEADPLHRSVAVRLSNSRLIRDLENVRWLFASIFLFTSVVFFILTRDMTRTILYPIEEIGRAAMSLADGEPAVEVPKTGDREIDELGEFITKLGESRRQSRVMMSPIDVLASHGWGRRGAKREGAAAGEAPDAGEEPARPPAEDPGH